ncbi:hypothetical protein ACFXB3_15320 [Streptomyces sp. NPDC059447]|uniref:hypothetical protein n=1 Tax=unclassified Streptomyces TaxID=2593676 RepID=UPI0036CFAB0B
MSAERAQGRGWVRIPASRGEQPAAARPAGYDPARGPAGNQAPTSHRAPYGSAYGAEYGYGAGHQSGQVPDHATIYLSLVKRWREAGRTLPGHPDEEWERLISQPCWPVR